MRKLIAVFLFFLSIFVAPHAYAEKSSGSSAALVSHAASTSRDARSIILEKFLTSYDSPLAPFAQTFVDEADEHGLDWKLLTAISGVESTFGREIPNGSHNAWGWGIYGDQAIYFSSWEEGIKTISRQLRETYMDRWGATNVYAIGRYYASSPTWASRVTHLMEKIEAFALDNPTVSLSLTI